MKERIQRFLRRFSFKTGVILMALCVPFYIISFAQALLPISTTAKTILWVVFYGLAKSLKYAGLAIVGVGGWERIKRRWRRKKQSAGKRE